MKSIDIIGAGIGGLTTAIALKRKGLNIQIFEQADSIKPIGAGIILASNAMQVYEKLGLRNEIEEKGNPVSSMNITKPDLKPLSKIDLKYFENIHKVKNIAIHRGVLQQILIDKLKTTEINLNYKLKDVRKKDKEYLLTFDNDTTYKSSILLGADGLNSTVRQKLFPKSTIRNAKQICWRGITEFSLPLKFKNELNEAWGKTERFGFVQISENKVYWYALKSFKNNSNLFSVENITDYFSEFHPIIREIISVTSKERINTAEISDLKPTKFWHQENVCLIGDAAHATTPNMGQGACQAIEDAYVLSECISNYEINEAFYHFQKIRISKAHKIVKASWLVGKMAHISNPIFIKLRDQMMQLTPSSINRKQSEQIFQLANI